VWKNVEKSTTDTGELNMKVTGDYNFHFTPRAVRQVKNDLKIEIAPIRKISRR